MFPRISDHIDLLIVVVIALAIAAERLIAEDRQRHAGFRTDWESLAAAAGVAALAAAALLARLRNPIVGWIRSYPVFSVGGGLVALVWFSVDVWRRLLAERSKRPFRFFENSAG